MYGKPCKRDWVAKVVFLIQMLLTFGGRYNHYFWDTRLKLLRLLNFNMLFKLVLAKFFKSELFSCLPKVGHVFKSCKEPIYPLMSHFRVARSLCFKARLSVKPVTWKWLFTSGPMQMKYIFTRKALHLACFKSEGFWNYEIAGLHVTTWRPCWRASISLLWELNSIFM